jgi:hypothetical protein
MPVRAVLDRICRDNGSDAEHGAAHDLARPARSGHRHAGPHAGRHPSQGGDAARGVQRPAARLRRGYVMDNSRMEDWLGWSLVYDILSVEADWS